MTHTSGPGTVGPIGPYGGYVFRDPTDVLGRRAVAKLIDWALSAPIGLMVLWWLFTSADQFAIADAVAYCQTYLEANKICIPREGEALIIEVSPLAVYLPSFVWWLVLLSLEATRGWTPGKLIVGLRVVRQDDGRAIGFGKSLIRALVWPVDAFACGIVGYAVARQSPGHTRLGDRAASTVVVSKEAAGSRPWIVGLTVPAIDLKRFGTGQAAPWAPGYPTEAPAVTNPVAAPGSATEWSRYAPDTPVWDAERRAYIQYDTPRGTWLEYDEAASAWKPIST